MNVLVWSERRDVLRELLTPARALGGEVVAVTSGDPVDADRVVIVPAAPMDTMSAVIAAVIAEIRPEVVLLGATREGAEIAARLAQRLGVACASGATALTMEGGALVAERRELGRFVGRQCLEGSPAIATIAPRRFEPPPPGPVGEVVQLAVDIPLSRVEVVNRRPRAKSQMEIEDARVVVSAGRGFRKAADLVLVADLARALGGEVGASRPVTDDLQWLPADVKVGLSGHTVRPELYVACGISGQVEHIVGMREARLVVAVNLDERAPIFREADFCIVGDLYAVLPALTRALAQSPRK